jgi:hypothetical protein
MIKLDGIATFVANNALVPFPNHANLRVGTAAPARFDAGAGTKRHVSGFRSNNRRQIGSLGRAIGAGKGVTE